LAGSGYSGTWLIGFVRQLSGAHLAVIGGNLSLLCFVARTDAYTRKSRPVQPHMVNAIDLVIFDCDGVLVDSEIVSFEAESAAFAEVGIDVTGEELLARFLGMSSASIFAAIEAERGVRLPADFPARAARRIREAFEQRLRPIPGVGELLESLALRKCVASSSEPARIRHSLALARLLHHFEPHIFSATQVKRGKPAPDLFLLAAESMGTPPGRCLVIEDSVAGITAARAAGMAVLGFSGGGHCRDGHAGRLRSAGAAEVCATMAEVARRLGQLTPPPEPRPR
jgi:HAD superfamily hydrolase (TIGR01509 family)